MQFDLTITARAFRQILELLKANPGRPLSFPAGLSRHADRIEALVPSAQRHFATAELQPSQVLFLAAPTKERLIHGVRSALPRVRTQSAVAILGLGVGAASGEVIGLFLDSERPKPLDSLRVIGPGLPVIRVLHNASDVEGSGPRFGTRFHLKDIGPQSADAEIWSRTIGALGEDSWQRLTSLQFAIAGCGRSGSLVVNSLDRLGARHLSLIDPDFLEPHNVGETDLVNLSDVGQPKCLAIRAHLADLRMGSSGLSDTTSGGNLALSVTSEGGVPHQEFIAESILSFDSLVAAKRADVLVSCVDSPSARLGVAFLATLYLKPLIDIGTGIFLPGTNPRQMGADIRLVLPDHCLLCFGGVARYSQARTELLAPSPDNSSTRSIEWRQQRAGSLRSLNQIAVGFGVRMLEDFVGGRIEQSTWLHLDISDRGIPLVEHRLPEARAHCALCSTPAQGDAGLASLPSLL